MTLSREDSTATLQCENRVSYKYVATSVLKGQGGLHQDFLKIDFLVVSDRGE